MTGYSRSSCALLGAFLLFCAVGCATGRMVELRPEPASPLTERLNLTAFSGPQATDRTRLLLRRYGLPERIGHRPEKLVARLEQIHATESDAEILHAIAELSFITGKKYERSDQRLSFEHYLNCVTRAYEYLFDADHDFVRNPYDPQFRSVCDLYNGALEGCLRMGELEEVFQPGRDIVVTLGERKLHVSFVSKSRGWKATDFSRFEFVSDYEIRGLRNTYRTYGLGVPLIAVRREGTLPPQQERYYAPNLSVPVTAFLRLKPTPPALLDSHSSAPKIESNVSYCVLELYDPLEQTEIDVATLDVPLESDLSTPLAYFLEDRELHQLDTLGLLKPNEAQHIAGLYLIEPYEPGKIPVLFLHGLWSSPMTWMEALNDLRSDPEIRKNYQFWFYFYPSGEPFWKTAADLRDDLNKADQAFAGNTIRDMVVVGHSMGGLIARMLTIDSGDAYWRAVSDKPLEDLRLTAPARAQLEREFFFQRHPAVSRVITIATPYRGSRYANSFTQWLGRRAIELPSRTLIATRQLLTLDPNAPELFALTATSVDGLSENAPILQVLAETPRQPDVRYHNVVGVVEDVPFLKRTDGVVNYASAHRNDVDSEITVPAHHNQVHQHPLTIREIRRVLLEHRDNLSLRKNAVTWPESLLNR